MNHRVAEPLSGWPSLTGASPEEAISGRSALAVIVAVGALLGLLVGIVLAIFVPIGIAAGVGVAVLVVLASLWRASAAALCRWSLGARPATPDEQPEVRNLVDSLCAGMGLRPPKLWVLDSNACDAASFSASRGDSNLVVTTSLAASLSRLELEAALAHELAHFRISDVRQATLRGATLGIIGAVFGARTLACGSRWGAREAAADGVALRFTRHPPSLLEALSVMSPPRSVPRRRDAIAGHLWAVPIAPIDAATKIRLEALSDL